MSYQWKVGELAVCVEGAEPEGLKHGLIYPVKEIASFHDFEGNTGLKVVGCETHKHGSYGFWRASRFRTLHGTDIRKLEEKYPEYVIKTNEVEG